MKKIAVVGVPGGWSSEALADAVAKRTGNRVLVDMAQASLDLHTGSLRCQGHDLRRMDAVIIKKIAPSYSPAVLDRLEMLRCLDAWGVPTFSRAERILRLIDRLACTVSLRLGGIPMPRTTITEDVAVACNALQKYGRAVFKPLYSTKARGMVLLDHRPSACEDISSFQAEGNKVMYMQEYVPDVQRDLGVSFLGGEYLATYARQSGGGSWNTTTRSGGRYVAVEPGQDIIDLAHKAQALFGLDFTCVDVVETADGPQVYEVSAFGGFRGLLEANGLDAAALYADYVLRKIA